LVEVGEVEEALEVDPAAVLDVLLVETAAELLAGVLDPPEQLPVVL